MHKTMVLALLAFALSACGDDIEPTDAGVDCQQCRCEPSWPFCPDECLPPLDAGVDAPVVATVVDAPDAPVDAGL